MIHLVIQVPVASPWKEEDSCFPSLRQDCFSWICSPFFLYIVLQLAVVTLCEILTNSWPKTAKRDLARTAARYRVVHSSGEDRLAARKWSH